ncbi:unnamed protein product [Bursaphelenchus xylophilus]|uniref:(pine wood nematode) hypothetical protein n=1 Tax=Bursaphelenchus xylophilus TaxID=6326 RepID=A0A1I7RPF1_BURXY|nr:unnamed protein product [Bursaphelenchus xylophilus]CAG9095921.1 unnamed protein product [Bursaphelenchus xylophilus]
MYPSTFVTHDERADCLDRWISESCDIKEVNISVFAFLTQIGKNKIVIDYVNDNLTRTIFENEDFRDLMSDVSQGKVDLNRDDRVEKVLTDIFLEINKQCTKLNRDGEDGAAIVMTIFINDFFYTVDFGNIIVILGKDIGDPNDLALFPMTEGQEGLMDKMGFFGCKDQKLRPKVVGSIQMNKSIKFLMFANASLINLVIAVKHDDETTGNSYLASILLEKLKNNSDITLQMEQTLSDIAMTYKSITSDSNHPGLAMAYLDLSNEIKQDKMEKVETEGLVPSYVDWSDFYNSPNKDEVIVKIESLRTYYDSKKNLSSIAED